MKQKQRFLSQAARLLALGAMLTFSRQIWADEIAREKLLMDLNWKFHLGNDWGTGEELINLGISTGPAKPSFNDTSWTPINLPHDRPRGRAVRKLPPDSNRAMPTPRHRAAIGRGRLAPAISGG